MHINPQQLHLFYLFIHFLYKSVVLGIIRVLTLRHVIEVIKFRFANFTALLRS